MQKFNKICHWISLKFFWWQAFKGNYKRLLFQSSEQLWLCSKNPFLDIFWYKLTCFIFLISSVCRAFPSHLLRAVSTRSTLFEKYISVFSVKTLKTTYCLGNCSIPNALDMQKVGGKIIIVPFSWTLLPFFSLYHMHALIF